MVYSKISTNALKEFHSSIKKCLDEDDKTPIGNMKPYGVREFSDWAEHLNKIEAELSNRNENYTSISLGSGNSQNKPTPVEYILYERIKSCLAIDDRLATGVDKEYGVRKFEDWRRQADSLERALDNMNYGYTKIIVVRLLNRVAESF